MAEGDEKKDKKEEEKPEDKGGDASPKPDATKAVAAAGDKPLEAGADTPLPTEFDGLVLYYFPIFAKGPSIALALQHSGLKWKGYFVLQEPYKWKVKDGEGLKAKTPWGTAPVLEIPGLGLKKEKLMIGHEHCILHYIATKCPELRGANDFEFVVSLQLLAEAEDVYMAVQRCHATCFRAECPDPDMQEVFWENGDDTVHNRSQGVWVYLAALERFYENHGGREGKFTESGVTIGECKLFVSLHILVMLREDVLEDFPNMLLFYTRFAKLAPTKAVLETGGEMPGLFKQYFLAPPPEEEEEGAAEPG